MAAPPALGQAVPAFIRARGGVRLTIGGTPAGSAPLAIAEGGGYRVRFPRGEGCEGVLINTGGGLAGGDRMTVDALVSDGAAAALTTQAAEKVYRSESANTEIAIRLRLDQGSHLDWLPQEQILFDGARLARSLDVTMARDASLFLAESVVFGRIAMGETVQDGLFRDRWRIRRDGRLVFAEEVRLAAPIAAGLAGKAAADGARALATLLYVAPDAEKRLEGARAILEEARSESGASAFDGMLIARFLSPDPKVLRADIVRFVERFRGRAMPRSWQS